MRHVQIRHALPFLTAMCLCAPQLASADVSSVSLSGEIDKEFYLDVERAVQSGAEEIRIESSGGSNVWALQAATALNRSKATQLVLAGSCVSACASLAFATDNVRVTRNAFLAVHRTSLGMLYVLEAAELDLSEDRFEALRFYAAEEARLLEEAGRSADFFEQAMRETRPQCYEELLLTKSGLLAGYKSRAEADYWMFDEGVFNHYRGVDVSGDWPNTRDLYSNKEALNFVRRNRVVRTLALEDLTSEPIDKFGNCPE